MILSAGLESAIFALLFVAVLFCAATNRARFLWMTGFLLPMMVPRLTLSVGVDWFKVLGPLGIILALILRPRGVGVAKSQSSGFYWFVAYITILTLVWMWIEYAFLQRYRFAHAMGLSGAQADYKMPVQLGSFVGQILVVFVPPLWARTRKEAWSAIRGFIAGCMTSCVAGLLGMVFLGAGTLNGAASRGTFMVDGSRFIRLGGLSGEPKFLAASLAVVLFFSVSQWAFGTGSERKRMGLLALVTLGMIFATYSASTWGGVSVGGVIFLFYLLRHLRGTQMAGLLTLGVALVLAISSTAMLSGAVQQAIYEKVFGENSNIEEMKDLYVVYAFQDMPQYLPIGFGLGGGDLAVMPYVGYVHLKYERTPTPSFTGFRMLGDLGLIGLALFHAQVATWSRTVGRENLAFRVFILCSGVALMLTSQAGLGGFLFVAGAALAVVACPAEEEAVVVAPSTLRHLSRQS